MSRKTVFLNVVLLALAAVLAWRVRTTWVEAQEHERGVLEQAAKRAQVLPPPAAPAVEPATPADYIDVAQRTLFSPDRDPTVTIEVEAPPPPPPPPPMPPLPAYHGQMSLGEPVVVLSLNGDDQKSYRAGETVGEFTVVAWDSARLVLEWNGETVERDFEALKPVRQEGKEKGARRPAARDKAAPRANAAQMGAKAEAGEPVLGRQVGAFRTCETGDTSPAGTVKDGYRKVMSQGLMGPDCHWEQIQ